jgi:hypothetical protein
MRALRAPLSFYALFLGTSCGAGSSSTPASDPATAEEKVVGPPDKKWTEMGPLEKGKFMKAVVMPRMKPLFMEFDSREFAEFACETCHGKSAKARAFKMPNPEMFVLPGDEAGFGKLMQEKPEWVKFMGERVKPEMAKLLALPEFDPKNPQPGAFSCGNCHTSE